jgi:aminopeptidase N
MRTDTGQVFRLEDYQPSDYLIPATDLSFALSPDATQVTARLTVRRREGVAATAPLILDGDELVLEGITVDGRALSTDEVEVSPQRLVVKRPPEADQFNVEIRTRLAPASNTKLMGLYLSNGVYCTQCEAEGFRRITYYLDRPDILSVYTVRIEAARDACPLLLSNGNPGDSGSLPGGRHFAVWHDPFPKPAYLFALVAGDLGAFRDEFTTSSGRRVDLAIHVEKGKEPLAAYAMDALKRSMRWDEEVFGREYDLDVFNIVAVSDFNIGAMENKGLNIFNDKYVLADEETATDTDFAHIEAIIAHEYFHNWTGNRITCRDWFQLCLKEGLTVFRDHEFSADMRSRAVKRIAEVRTLRAHQFPEDQGPLAHPVRPRKYREINNFYTPTVYEKGSEVVRMIRTIVGVDRFRAGMDLYFERHDGDAATIEDFLAVFEETSGHDLSQFSLWYHQAGTPNVSASESYDPASGTLTLELEQSLSPTPSENRKRLMHIPLAFGLVGADGEDVAAKIVEGAGVENGVIHLRKRRQVLRFGGLSARPAVSLNRSFSAPVTLNMSQRPDDLLFLARHDGDLFSRWQAFNTLLTGALLDGTKAVLGGKAPHVAPALVALAGNLAADASLEPAFRALALTLPSEADVAREIGRGIDPEAVFVAREALVAAIAAGNEHVFRDLYDALRDSGPFSPDAAGAGRRALRNVLLDYLSVREGGAALAVGQFDTATNMTDRAAALAVLLHRHGASEAARTASASFEERYASTPLVLDKWFQIRATAPGADALETVRGLVQHPGFSLANPNRARALLGSYFSGNQTGFHRADGAGYAFFAQVILEIEALNPQVAARLATALRSWRSLEPVRQEHARAALLSIAARPTLSADLRDIVERTLG